MNIAFYNASLALKAYQKNIDNLSNNIANVSTAGFKGATAGFEDLLYTQIDNQTPQLNQGHGVRLATLKTDFTQGFLQRTEKQLDFAILGEGFFAFSEQDSTVFSRNGAFSLSANGDSMHLVDSSGRKVLDSRFQPISIPLDADGNPVLNDILGQLGVFRFDNPGGLLKSTGSTFAASDNSGMPEAIQDEIALFQGALEMSNVEIGSSMAALIEGQRALQLNSRVIVTADQIEEIINTLRG
jgi:flagellar basal-body rod protein FlgG